MTPETDILVEFVEVAIKKLKNLGAKIIMDTTDIPVGKVAVGKDPFGNILTLVDLSKGIYVTDDQNIVTGTTDS